MQISVRLFDESLSTAHNLHLLGSGQSQVSLRSVSGQVSLRALLGLSELTTKFGRLKGKHRTSGKNNLFEKHFYSKNNKD